MPRLSNNALDGGPNYVIANGSKLHICSQEPTTYAEANATFALGNKTGIVPTGPTDGATDGRRCTIPAVSDGSVTGSGTATHWAITDGVGELIAAGPLSSSQAVTSGNVFTTTAFDITFRDPTAV